MEDGEQMEEKEMQKELGARFSWKTFQGPGVARRILRNSESLWVVIESRFEEMTHLQGQSGKDELFMNLLI